MLDAASTDFHVIFPFILMYIVTEAGMGNPAGGFRSTQGQAENAANTGASVARGSRGFSSTAQEKVTKYREAKSKSKCK